MKSKKMAVSGDQQEYIKPILSGLPVSVFESRFREDTYSYVNWHWHEAFQYSIVTEGIVDFHLPGKIMSVTEGSGIFINYRCMHLIRSHEDTPASYMSVDIPPSFLSYDTSSRIYTRYLRPVMEHPVPEALFLSRHNEEELRILTNIRKIRDLIHNEELLCEIDVRIAAMEIWKLTYLKLLRYLPETGKRKDDSGRLREILSYIHEHYAEKLTLDDIADHVALSRGECSRYFKAMTDQQLFSYVNSYRLNKSIDLMRDTDLGFAEIADSVGFCSQSYYTDCFRREKGITPKKYRSLIARTARGILKEDML